MRGLSRVAHVTPRIVTIDGRAQLVSGAGDVVQGFDPATGRKLWEFASKGEGVVPSVVSGGGLIFTTSGFGDPAIRAIRVRAGTPELVWEIRRAVPMIPSFAYVSPYLFTISEGGIAMCIRAETGDVLWQQRIGGTHYASPIAADGKVYFLSETGETTIVEASPQFNVIARNPLNAPAQASFAASRGQLLIRTQEHLYSIGRVAP